MRKSPKNSRYADYNNRKHKNPSPEEMECGTYSFTYNPAIQPITPNFKLDLITWHNGMDNIFRQCQYSHIELRPELSQGSRWHYHGQITIKDIMKFFIYDLPVLRANGAYEIDIINDKDKWKQYISKQEYLMKPITKEHLIPYHYDNEKIMKVKVNPLNDTKFSELLNYDDEAGSDDESR